MTSLLLGATLYAAFASGMLLVRQGGGRQVRPLVTAATLVVTGSVSVLQFVIPWLLPLLRRDPQLLLHGQWWRLATPLVVQDGGWPGTVFNLLSLLLVGIAAERVLGRRRWLVLYLGTGLAAEVIAYAWIHQGFAGNSIANFGLAAGLSVQALFRGRGPVRATGGVAALAGLILLVTGNLHGAAFLVGCVLALGMTVLGGAPGTAAGSGDQRNMSASAGR
ncbi:MAG TPA: rhomboid family intramembrane serine protease [Candidatus Dormibacteraeota bacterium]|nr:rhomboid family intramembrane serine protease [Candidatus Dormibacteraeota bacterium]